MDSHLLRYRSCGVGVPGFFSDLYLVWGVRVFLDPRSPPPYVSGDVD